MSTNNESRALCASRLSARRRFVRSSASMRERGVEPECRADLDHEREHSDERDAHIARFDEAERER